MKCDQHGCEEIASYKMFWPGNPSNYICNKCKSKAEEAASAMGFYLHLEEIK